MEEKLIQIPNENIIICFYIEQQEYIVFADNPEIVEGDQIYFAKREYINDETSIIRNIENEDTYNTVTTKYQSILQNMEEKENETNY